MSGYPGGGYPGNPGNQGGYPGGTGGYPGGSGGGGGGGYPGGTGSYPCQGGGYAPPRPAAPPNNASGQPSGGYPGAYGSATYGAPQVDPSVQAWFRAVDSDGSGQINATELQRALVNGNWSHFSEEACRMMIDMFDRDRSGTIDLFEFGNLFNYINQWKATFESIDTDRSGFVEFAELTRAFQQMGYRFTPTFVQNILAKYDPRTRKLGLDNFIVSCVQIKRLTDSFRTRDRELKGQATMQYEDFVGLAMGAHK